jgi:hypothetical protein
MSERVLPEVAAAVLRRDRQCLAAMLDRSHWPCRDKWGETHAADDMGKLTIEHVRTDPGGARRSDELHLVALCHHANAVDHWGSSTDNRALLNAYLQGVRHAGRET